MDHNPAPVDQGVTKMDEAFLLPVPVEETALIIPEQTFADIIRSLPYPFRYLLKLVILAFVVAFPRLAFREAIAGHFMNREVVNGVDMRRIADMIRATISLLLLWEALKLISELGLDVKT